VTRWEPVNRYDYNRYGLFIPYAVANAFTFFTVVVSLVCLKRHGALPGSTFGDLENMIKDPEMTHVVKGRKRSLTGVVENGRYRLHATEKVAERPQYQSFWKRHFTDWCRRFLG